MIAYPLQWPPGWPRTERPSRSAFKVTEETAKRNLVRELSLLGARDVVISTNMPIRQDGLPYASRRAPEDAGIAVYFTLNGTQQCIPCDRWRTLRENMQAVTLTVGALRGLDRWGAKEMVDAAFSGFKALPEGRSSAPTYALPWYEILQVSPQAGYDIITAAYRKLAMKAHPDNGGSQGDFERIKSAYDEGMRI